MLKNNLGPGPPYKHDGEIVEPPDLALEPYAVDEKHSHITFVGAEKLEKCVLNRRGPLGRHVRTPFEHPHGTLICSARKQHDVSRSKRALRRRSHTSLGTCHRGEPLHLNKPRRLRQFPFSKVSYRSCHFLKTKAEALYLGQRHGPPVRRYHLGAVFGKCIHVLLEEEKAARMVLNSRSSTTRVGFFIGDRRPRSLSF